MPEVLGDVLGVRQHTAARGRVWNECDLYEAPCGAPLRGGNTETKSPSSCCITNKAAAETHIGLYTGMFLLMVT